MEVSQNVNYTLAYPEYVVTDKQYISKVAVTKMSIIEMLDFVCFEIQNFVVLDVYCFGSPILNCE